MPRRARKRRERRRRKQKLLGRRVEKSKSRSMQHSRNDSGRDSHESDRGRSANSDSRLKDDAASLDPFLLVGRMRKMRRLGRKRPLAGAPTGSKFALPLDDVPVAVDLVPRESHLWAPEGCRDDSDAESPGLAEKTRCLEELPNGALSVIVSFLPTAREVFAVAGTSRALSSVLYDTETHGRACCPDLVFTVSEKGKLPTHPTPFARVLRFRVHGRGTFSRRYARFLSRAPELFPEFDGLVLYSSSAPDVTDQSWSISKDVIRVIIAAFPGVVSNFRVVDVEFAVAFEPHCDRDGYPVVLQTVLGVAPEEEKEPEQEGEVLSSSDTAQRKTRAVVPPRRHDTAPSFLGWLLSRFPKLEVVRVDASFLPSQSTKDWRAWARDVYDWTWSVDRWKVRSVEPPDMYDADVDWSLPKGSFHRMRDLRLPDGLVVDDLEVPGTPTLQSLSAILQTFSQLRSVQIVGGFSFRAFTVVIVANSLPNLEWAEFQKCGLSFGTVDAGLKKVERNRRLRYLGLQRNQFESIKAVAGLMKCFSELNVLNLSNCTVGLDCSETAEQPKRDVDRQKHSDDESAQFGSVETLLINDSGLEDFGFLSKFLVLFPGLKRLLAQGNQIVPLRDDPAVVLSSTLEELQLGTPVADWGYQHRQYIRTQVLAPIFRAFPRLESLSLQTSGGIDVSRSRSEYLTRLDILGSELLNETSSLSHLFRCFPHLEELKSDRLMPASMIQEALGRRQSRVQPDGFVVPKKEKNRFRPFRTFPCLRRLCLGVGDNITAELVLLLLETFPSLLSLILVGKDMFSLQFSSHIKKTVESAADGRFRTLVCQVDYGAKLYFDSLPPQPGTVLLCFSDMSDISEDYYYSDSSDDSLVLDARYDASPEPDDDKCRSCGGYPWASGRLRCMCMGKWAKGGPAWD